MGGVGAGGGERLAQQRGRRALPGARRAALEGAQLLDQLPYAFQLTGPAVSRCPVSGRPSTVCTSRAAPSTFSRSTPVS